MNLAYERLKMTDNSFDGVNVTNENISACTEDKQSGGNMTKMIFVREMRV